jgi:hypothetical protein
MGATESTTGDPTAGAATAEGPKSPHTKILGGTAGWGALLRAGSGQRRHSHSDQTAPQGGGRTNMRRPLCGRGHPQDVGDADF